MSETATKQTCDECGGSADFEFDDQAYCSSCYYARGSCCNERPEHFGEAPIVIKVKKLGE